MCLGTVPFLSLLLFFSVPLFFFLFFSFASCLLPHEPFPRVASLLQVYRIIHGHGVLRSPRTVAIDDFSSLMTSSSSKKYRKQQEDKKEEDFDVRSDGLILAVVLAVVVVFRSSLDSVREKKEVAGSSALEVLVQTRFVEKEKGKK